MRFFVRLFLVFVLLGLLGYAVRTPISEYLARRAVPTYRFAAVQVGGLATHVSATGEVKPVQEVSVGAFVSGPIIALNADFNDQVKQGDLLAQIDPKLFAAAVESDEANLINRNAEAERIRVLLEQSTRNLERIKRLQRQGDGFVSESEIDEATYSRLSLMAQLKIAEAAIRQAAAALENSRTNLNYTRVIAPVSGTVIDRKIDLGQTLAAQFQTPEMFVIAPRMEEEMHIYASVDEADIGLVRKDMDSRRDVSFTVDAYPDQVFIGKIKEIRLRSTSVQNVVTYPVVVTTTNQDLKLMPGMTANLVFVGDQVQNVKLVSNAALRFYPEKGWVRVEDQHLLESTDQSNEELPTDRSSAEALLGIDPARRRRHVWVQEGLYLRAIEVTTGMSDYRMTEVQSETLAKGSQLVIGTVTVQ